MSKDIVKPSILPGFMELLPSEQILFNKMKDTIRRNYEKFGFLPIDTPVMEKAEVLLAKGGGETEQQIYRFKKGDTDLALRFDLTVPVSRYVAQHFSELTFPYRRYHIGKVYRGEKAQRGRFREFYQCDIDIIGNGTLDIINDAEIPSIIYSTFKDLGFDSFTIRINNRKVLIGFFQYLGIDDSTEVLRTVDKLEKIGLGGVVKELNKLGYDTKTIDTILEFVKISGSNDEIIDSLTKLGIENDLFLEGLEELKAVNYYVELFGVPVENYIIDLSIARGLDYYTGTVYETLLNDYPQIGSVCSGGRYDDLAEYYTNQKLPGVGISIGLTRLFYQLNEVKLIEVEKSSLTDVIILPMEGFIKEAVEIGKILRDNDIYVQVYLEEERLGKKLGFADKLNIPFSIIIGEDEVKKGRYTFRDMITGEQSSITVEEILKRLK